MVELSAYFADELRAFTNVKSLSSLSPLGVIVVVGRSDKSYCLAVLLILIGNLITK